MKRIVIATTILLVGACINIVVAISSTLFWQRHSPPIIQPTTDQRSLLYERFGLAPLSLPPSARIEALGYLETSVGTQGMDPSMPYYNEHVTVTEIQAGFPFKALQRHVVESQTLAQYWKSQSWLRPAVASARATHPVVPSSPIWPGFVVNTIIYTAILWVLYFAPAKVRRFSRAKRGRCPACAYRIAPGTGSVCSECGTPLNR